MAKAKKSDDNLDTGFNPKYMKLIQHISETLDSQSTEELKETIVKAQKSISDIEKDMEADERLKALKDEIKDISGGYKDVAKVETAKTMYAVHVLRTRGEK